MIEVRKTSGQMLLESVLAMGIIVVGVVGVVSLASRSIGESRVVADQFVGVNLASEGLEVAKNILGANSLNGRPWNEGFGDGDYEVTYASTDLVSLLGAPRNLSFDPGTGLFDYGGPRGTTFTRVINIRRVNDHQIRAKARVNWKSRDGGNKTVTLETGFLNWR
ncbi:MAG: hypothetical protein HYW37_02280 [Candidatus Colwellbacteria bacterium]|nr:hypothetical protein [Candidatus Colwellbacteria bacterium]